MTHASPTTISLDPPWPFDPDATAISVPTGAGRAYCAGWIAAMLRGEPARKPRKPTLASVAKQANKAAIPVARYEVKPDGTVVVVTGKPVPVAPEDPWPLDEFRTKETKQ